MYFFLECKLRIFSHQQHVCHSCWIFGVEYFSRLAFLLLLKQCCFCFSSSVELAMIMDRLYGGVCYAGIDTDPELKYPKGAGRVAFSNQQSYIAAISARFVQLQHGEIDKRVSGKKREPLCFSTSLLEAPLFLKSSPHHSLTSCSFTSNCTAFLLTVSKKIRFLLKVKCVCWK